MYNIFHLASSRGIGDTMRPRRPRPAVQPAGLSHVTMIAPDGDAAPDRAPRRAAEDGPPAVRPSPSSG